MSHAAQHQSDKKSDETGASIKNERQTPTGVQTVEALLAGSVDPVYAAKAQALNDAIQSIGMGRYQWDLFIVVGFGYFVDNLYPVVTGLILPPVLVEFSGSQGPWLKLAQNIGLLLGAAVWGLGSDIWGRRISFNITLLIVGIFGTAAGGSPNYTTLSAMAGVWSIGVGGNLPVDSSLFLEFLPASHGYLLTVLSIWWAFGQLVGALVAWPLIANFSCPTTITPGTCLKEDNMGWRYFLFTMGGLMLILWGIRFFLFKLTESPKFLMGRGRDADAVAAVHRVATYNKKTIEFTEDSLKRAGESADIGRVDGSSKAVDATAKGALLRQLEKFDMSHIKALFATPKLAWSSTLVISLWALIGLAFPLYNAFISIFLTTRGTDFGDSSVYMVYRNLVILSVIGVPGAILAGWMVDFPYLGRKGTLAISTLLTGVFLFCGTTARTSNALLGWNCAYTFTSNVMYGVLYAMTPELFPTKDRGTGNGVAATANRIFGIMSPIVAQYANLNTPAPIYISGTLFLAAGLIALLLPFETRGKASL